MNNRTDMNDNVQNVFELQNMLWRMSFISENIRRINPDGIFGAETTEAVKSFQALKISRSPETSISRRGPSCI